MKFREPRRLFAKECCNYCDGRVSQVTIHYNLSDLEDCTIVRACKDHKAPLLGHIHELSQEELLNLQARESPEMIGDLAAAERDGYFVVNSLAFEVQAARAHYKRICDAKNLGPIIVNWNPPNNECNIEFVHSRLQGILDSAVEAHANTLQREFGQRIGASDLYQPGFLGPTRTRFRSWDPVAVPEWVRDIQRFEATICDLDSLRTSFLLDS